MGGRDPAARRRRRRAGRHAGRSTASGRAGSGEDGGRRVAPVGRAAGLRRARMRLLGDLGTRTPPGAVDVITEPDLTLPDPGPAPATPAPARDRAAGRRGRLRSTALPLPAILVLAPFLPFSPLAAPHFTTHHSAPPS